MISYERMYFAYEDCMQRKSDSPSALQFSFVLLPKEIVLIVDDINDRTYIHGRSSCFGITYPTAREIYAAQFRDRVVQHFFCQEIEPLLENVLIDTTCSCRKHKGTDYALRKLKEFVTEDTDFGKSECYYLKLDMSGYFMSIRRRYVTQLMINLINSEYKGPYKDELLYLAPIIYMNNPAKDRIMRMPMSVWEQIPERKRMNPNGTNGLAIGNITAQDGSNLNLNPFDHYCIYDEGFVHYVRYVDDAIMLYKSRTALEEALPRIEAKLAESCQSLNRNKTKIDSVYHGIKFLGRVTYPYGYQRMSKESVGRVIKSANEFVIDQNYLSKLNSQAGRMKHYAAYGVMMDYIKALPRELDNLVYFDRDKWKFVKLKEETCDV